MIALPADVTLQLAGTPSAAYVQQQAQSTLARAAALRPGTTIELAPLTLPPLHPGDVVDVPAQVTVHEPAQPDDPAVTTLHLRVGPFTPSEPGILLYSDDPEYVSSDGVLFASAPIEAAHPVRAYIYHVTRDVPRNLSLVLRTTGESSQVQVRGSVAGPSQDYAAVGHGATARYLDELHAQEAFVATVTPDAPFVMPLGDRMLQPGELVAAIEDLQVVTGAPVTATVVASSAGVDPLALVAQPELPSDGHARKGAFRVAQAAPLVLRWTAGAPEADASAVALGAIEGVPEFPNLRTGGRPLAGDYGVLRPVKLVLTNAGAAPQTVYLYEIAEGGPATTTFWFSGDTAPTEVACDGDADNRYLVKAFAVAPDASVSIDGTFMTDGASAYPIEFGLSATQPPAPAPDSCAPK